MGNYGEEGRSAGIHMQLASSLWHFMTCEAKFELGKLVSAVARGRGMTQLALIEWFEYVSPWS